MDYSFAQCAPTAKITGVLYDPKEVTLLGERYGYELTGEYGYDYITGGGG